MDSGDGQGYSEESASRTTIVMCIFWYIVVLCYQLPSMIISPQRMRFRVISTNVFSFLCSFALLKMMPHSWRAWCVAAVFAFLFTMFAWLYMACLRDRFAA